MFNKFQILFSKLIKTLNEDVSTSSAFGAPQAGFEITNPTSINQDKAYTDNIKAAMSIAQPNKRTKKKKKINLIKRKLPKNII